MVRPYVVILATIGRKKGRITDVPQIVSNLEAFPDSQWDCIALFWSTPEDADKSILQRCNATVAVNWKWASLLALADAKVRSQNYEHVCVMLEDIVIPKGFQVGRPLQLLHTTNYSMLSPVVKGATHREMQSMLDWPLQRMGALEIYLTFFTRRAWDCFAQLLHYTFPKTLHHKGMKIGWGFDMCYRPFCEALHGPIALYGDTVYHKQGMGLMGVGTENLSTNASQQSDELIRWTLSKTGKACSGFQRIAPMDAPHPHTYRRPNGRMLPAPRVSV